jgi:hypothetical protein
MGRPRALDPDALELQLRHGRSDDLQFLATDGAAFSCMRVKPSHPDLRIGDTEAMLEVMGNHAHRLHD